MKHAKTARLFEPIVAVKKYSRGFQCVYVSFQSTPSSHIVFVNALNECTDFVEIRDHSRRIYLATYLWIDVLGDRIQNSHIFYRVWKDWCSPMNNCLDITISFGYDIYL